VLFCGQIATVVSRLEEVDYEALKELRRSWCVGSEAYGFVPGTVRVTVRVTLS
jgi:hypothetical protein